MRLQGIGHLRKKLPLKNNNFVSKSSMITITYNESPQVELTTFLQSINHRIQDIRFDSYKFKGVNV